MEYNTIELENIEYYLVPKPIIMNLTDDIRIKFIKNKDLKYFLIELDGYHVQPYEFNFKVPDEYWTTFVRHEKEDGSYLWRDWANSHQLKDRYKIHNGEVVFIPYLGMGASDYISTLLEDWYQKNIIPVV